MCWCNVFPCCFELGNIWFTNNWSLFVLDISNKDNFSKLISHSPEVIRQQQGVQGISRFILCTKQHINEKVWIRNPCIPCSIYQRWIVRKQSSFISNWFCDYQMVSSLIILFWNSIHNRKADNVMPFVLQLLEFQAIPQFVYGIVEMDS